MTRIEAFIVTACLAALFLAAWVSPVLAHDWYDTKCCSGMDCAPVRTNRVVAGKGGWHVRLSPGDHPMVAREIDAIIPYDSKAVHRSQDSDFHVCVGAIANTLYCIYVPDMGS